MTWDELPLCCSEQRMQAAQSFCVSILPDEWQRAVQMRVQVYVSFGGLLMQLTGDLQKLQELDVDANIYLLMRKV